MAAVASSATAQKDRPDIVLGYRVGFRRGGHLCSGHDPAANRFHFRLGEPPFLFRRHFALVDLFEQEALIRLAWGNRLAGFAALENSSGGGQIQVGLADLVAMTLATFRLKKGTNVAFVGGGLVVSMDRTARAE